jgi:hypothetical protein
LADEDQPDAAMDICNRVLLDEPDNPSALFVVACVLRKAARYVQAIQTAKRLTEICPRDPKGWEMLANCWGELHRYDDSVRSAEKAYSLQQTGRTKATLGFALCNAGEHQLARKLCTEAIAECEAVLKSERSEAERKTYEAALTDAQVNLAYADLALGHWEAGFHGFRRTMRTKWRKEWTYGESKEWQGESDAVVMVTGEQGLGDEIMAASVIPQAVTACSKFVFDCDERLAPLFARSFPNVLVTPTRRAREVRLPVVPTHHKSLFGLSELFRQKDADFPRQPYLMPRADYVAMFKELFGGQRVIGLAWSGGLPRTGMQQRHAGVAAFLPLLRRGGAEFVSLEYKDDLLELMELQKLHGIWVRRLPWATRSGDTQDIELLAGLIAACDEVIGVGTTSMHLASAMGVPTTVLVNQGLGWCWARDEMLWYPPTTRLWRKQTGESWRDCVSRLVEDRKERIAA